MSTGYIYIAINKSLPGMVKIGKTHRDPQQRVKELSGATGVPTPFILLYNEFFSDCDYAEKQIHLLLETQNYRVAQNREFFYLEPHEAVKIINTVSMKLNVNNIQMESKKENTFSQYYNEEPITDSIDELIESLEGEAYCYYNGCNGFLPDEKKAIEIYKKAASLGSVESSRSLGEIYLNNNQNEKAIDYYKMALEFGDEESYSDITKLYLDKNKKIFNPSKAVAFWNHFFLSQRNKNIIENKEKANFDLIIEYLYQCMKYEFEPNHIDILNEFKDEIIGHSSYSYYDKPIFEKIINFASVRLHPKYNKRNPPSNFDGIVTDVYFVNENQVKLDCTIFKGNLKIGEWITIENFKGGKLFEIEMLAELYKKVGMITPGNNRMVYVKGEVEDFKFINNLKIFKA